MTLTDIQAAELKERIAAHGRALGFDAIGVASVDLARAEAGLADWLQAGFHGNMDYMARHGPPSSGGTGKRTQPAALVPGTLSVITARINYLSAPVAELERTIAVSQQAYVSVYARGRDYHKVVRNKLQKLAGRIDQELKAYGGSAKYRPFTDSAPVMEVALAEQSGLGWRGKHTLLLDRSAGSFFFLGEIYTDLALPPDLPVSDHCGQCFACRDACPTGAIVGPYRLDARRCISYLTIELKEAIPEQFRPLIGNRIYGCDDCQLACPWNKFAQAAAEPDFVAVRNGLDDIALVDLFAWSQDQFNTRMAGSAILRIGHEKWLSNIAVALGNALRGAPGADSEGDAVKTRIHQALQGRAGDASEQVRESVHWALAQSEVRRAQ